MGKIRTFFGRGLSRLSELFTFWSALPASVVALVSGYLASGVQWIAALGPFGLFSAGLVSFFLSSVGLAAIARAKLWRLESVYRKRFTGESSYFDPMARVYENQQLYLRDLAPLGRNQVSKKKFVNCEIIGPGNIVVCLRAPDESHYPSFTKNIYNDVDFIQIDPSKFTKNAIYFYGCDFDGCQFFTLNLLFYVREQWGEAYPWITLPNQQTLLEHDNEPSK